MSLHYEISEFKMALQAGIKRRKRRKTQRQNVEKTRLWPSVLSVASLVIIIAAVLLLPFDGDLSRFAVSANSWPVHSLRKLTNLVLAAPYVVLFTLIVMTCLIGRWRMREHKGFLLREPAVLQSYHRLGRVVGHSLFAVLAILSAGLIINILKYIIGRPRPFLIDAVGPFGFKPFDFTHAYVSFPSGHACTAAVLATLLALWFPCSRVFAYAGLVLIASSRVFVQAHYPTDVLIGFSIGIFTTLILSRFFAQSGWLFQLRGGEIFPELKYQNSLKF